MVKINQKISRCTVVEPTHEKAVVKASPMFNEKQIRPEELSGFTYRLKTPLSENAFYVTINNYEVDGQLRPFEVFINSKDISYFQWVVALTRVMSAVFRKGGEVNFLIEELKSVHDPKGGYFDKGRYVPSLVSAIGDVIETHLSKIGLYVKDTSLSEAAQQMVNEKLEKQSSTNKLMCVKCNEVSVVLMDGCLTCTSCGYSKCG